MSANTDNPNMNERETGGWKWHTVTGKGYPTKKFNKQVNAKRKERSATGASNFWLILAQTFCFWIFFHFNNNKEPCYCWLNSSFPSFFHFVNFFLTGCLVLFKGYYTSSSWLAQGVPGQPEWLHQTHSLILSAYLKNKIKGSDTRPLMLRGNICKTLRL